MAELPEKDRKAPRAAPSEAPDVAGSRRKQAADEVDPREEEGWTQPESSAQKGVERDEG